ncbi:hypothetical protein LCGC14_0431740 [marine sediment metagenome]|uniref:DUF4145 domain-containing protein n=1 Tax=marine sediment metagenome TaxID=412755 RepID=A0A0F9SU64_9ZZZZ|nr:DUF4145 domain-containing protein [Phycisphaerae bacterium]HDZ42864.1 DUF4145 domain-containing protein [Phycisphaerae bacterium]
MKSKYISPTLNSEAFNCPACHVFTKQCWSFLIGSSHADGFGLQMSDERFRVSVCEHCRFPTIWLGDEMIYPNDLAAEPPNVDLDDDVKADYNEARAIVNRSPRGAAALLRLAIQKLCKQLGKPGDNINADISALVADGLPTRVQQALDVVRVVGNNAVHPGAMDLSDDRETANALFGLVNIIAETMLTEPRKIEELYADLPESARAAIDKRDA